MKTQKSLIKLGERLANHAMITMPTKIRNPSALSPLLKKGGVHDDDNPKTRHKKERRAVKLQLQKHQWDGYL